MITIISTPGCTIQASPELVSRWVATESPNNFRLFRQDWLISVTASSGAFLMVTTSTPFTGSNGDAIAVYNATNGAMYVGTITNVAGDVLTTSITFVAGMNIIYLNDNTEYGGYYFEGRLTINDVVENLTVIASPDSFGYADLDVSGLLRIHTALGKIGDYTSQIMKETTKSGKWSFEYRYKTWTDLDRDWIPEGGSISPPSDTINWYYAEAVRSEEQGSNLSEYVPSDLNDAPFFNQFTEPVYFLGMPFDISFILPELAEVSPTSEITVTLKIYNQANAQLGGDIVSYVAADELEGFVCSLNIDETTIPPTAHHMTAEIELT